MIFPSQPLRIDSLVVSHGRNSGPLLTKCTWIFNNEENEPTNFLVSSAECGYGKTRREVMNIVEKVTLDKNILRESKISPGWLHRFLERQKNISLRQGNGT